MASLRKTLILGTTIGTAAVLLAIGILLYMLVRAGLIEQFDQSLIDKARLLASTIELEGDEIDLQFDEFDVYEFEKKDRPGYMQIWYGDGSVLFRSQSLGDDDLSQWAGSLESPAYYWLKLPDDRNGRAVGIVFAPKVEHYWDADEDDLRKAWKDKTSRITLVLARDTILIDQTLSRLEITIILAGAIAILVSGIVLWFVIRRSLRPLSQLAAEISLLDEEDLSTKVGAGCTVQELQPVKERLNDLLARLEAAFERERSFSADVAHELRTPLAGLRSTMEVALSKPRETGEYREALTDSLRISQNMQDMVENLLALVRIEAGQTEIKKERAFLDEFIRDTFKPMSEMASKKKLKIEWKLEAQKPVLVDPSLLRLVIRNILENAFTYADESGTVSTSTSVNNGEVEIRVCNSGSALTQEQAQEAFGRFWRGDDARSATGVHCGLGLSLVKKAISLLGGSVSVKSEKGGLFEISVTIPEM